MPRVQVLDDTDAQIVSAIRAHIRKYGGGPTYRAIQDVTGISLANIHYRVRAKLAPAGLVTFTPNKHRTLSIPSQ